jgi:hypothetical protein
MGFVIGLLIGGFLGVMLMCVLAVAADDPSQDLAP